MDSRSAPSKGCYNCMKRRINCDKTGTHCKKCSKKGLKCPGYGIRYRFARGSGAQAPASSPEQDGPAKGRQKTCKKPLRWIHAHVDSDGSSDASHSIADSEAPVPSIVESRQQSLETGESDNIESAEWQLSPPRSLEILDGKIRWMFQHFSDHVSPVMLLFDGPSNGYRQYVLPLAVSCSMVQRAVCVAAAFHMTRARPELRLPAEQGRTAIIQKLKEDVLTSNPIFDERTWATIILLIVGDLVTGDEQVMILYHMLDALLRARHSSSPSSPLCDFLNSQSKIIEFFGRPIVGEAVTIPKMMAMLTGPILSELSAADNLPDNSPQTQQHLNAYNEAFCLAARIYVHRACSSGDSIQETCIAHELDLLRRSMDAIDPAYPGAHVLVWPNFVGAAEAALPAHREFFTRQLERIWMETGFANVEKALKALPRLWEQRGIERWTSSLSEISMVVM